jgi:hypothetical protein
MTKTIIYLLANFFFSGINFAAAAAVAVIGGTGRKGRTLFFLRQ